MFSNTNFINKATIFDFINKKQVYCGANFYLYEENCCPDTKYGSDCT